jgi:hypothetical membrane protein
MMLYLLEYIIITYKLLINYEVSNLRNLLVLVSVIIPLASIITAASTSGWFNILDNALSDLGHATQSKVAPLFNAGLVLGGVLAYTVAITSRDVKRRYNAVLLFSALMLIFIGVFNEVYGKLHFYVSVLFFTGLLFFTAICALDNELSLSLRSTAIVVILVMITSWILHYTLEIPRGAALPELTCILTWLPFYLKIYYK